MVLSLSIFWLVDERKHIVGIIVYAKICTWASVDRSLPERKISKGMNGTICKCGLLVYTVKPNFQGGESCLPCHPTEHLWICINLTNYSATKPTNENEKLLSDSQIQVNIMWIAYVG